MATVKMSSLSTEYIMVEVRIRQDGIYINPTAFDVDMAFTALNVEPVTLDWTQGTWEIVNTDDYFARTLIGPSGTRSLPDGQYSVWIRIQALPEVPIRKVGKLVIT